MRRSDRVGVARVRIHNYMNDAKHPHTAPQNLGVPVRKRERDLLALFHRACSEYVRVRSVSRRLSMHGLLLYSNAWWDDGKYESIVPIESEPLQKKGGRDARAEIRFVKIHTTSLFRLTDRAS